MAWLSIISYASGTSVTNTIIENLGKDIRTWGANVDAAGNSLTNLAGITGYSSALTITSAIVAVQRDANIGGGTIANAQLVIRGATNVNKQLAIAFDTTANVGVIQSYFNGVAVEPLVLNPSGGNVGVGTSSPTSAFHVVGIPVYANNAAAITGGLTAGAFYRTGANPDPLCIVH